MSEVFGNVALIRSDLLLVVGVSASFVTVSTLFLAVNINRLIKEMAANKLHNLMLVRLLIDEDEDAADSIAREAIEGDR